MKKIFLFSLLGFLGLYLGTCGYYYFNQEKMIFAHLPLSENYQFQWEEPFEEIFLTTADKLSLNALLFKTENPKGVIYYLHGKSGNLKTWGKLAKTYTDLGYDIFLLDYRGFGKSGGKINSEEEFYADVQLAYDFLKKIYSENEIHLVGFSIGSGAATYLAMNNHPKKLILLAPYFQIDEKFKSDKFYLPKYLCKYEFPVDEMLPKVKIPVQIFYGDLDQIIDQAEVKALQSKLKPSDKWMELKNQGHNQIEKNPDYLKEWTKKEIEEIFRKYHVPILEDFTTELDFSSSAFKNDSEFVEFISNEAENKPINFGGHYTILEKSCGMDCTHIFMVDRKTRKLVDFNSLEDESAGFLYRANSGVLIRNSNYIESEDK
jgi:pimeloyl-ACP methyl ester carboxylesterase